MMIRHHAHLGYCTNIHPGESWPDVFEHLQTYYQAVKQELAQSVKMGIGLRLSAAAALELQQPGELTRFSAWLNANDLYVFTINGFPYGNFHGQPVKDQVHAPDWTTAERKDYTISLFHILATLLPDGMEGGVSTSPLTYRFWHASEAGTTEVKSRATENLIHVVASLVEIHNKTGKILHLDIEPEPDGLLETSEEYIAFFNDFLLSSGARLLAGLLAVDIDTAKQHIRAHIRLCYDVCHFAVGFEKTEEVIRKMHAHGLSIGKMQISSALSGSVAHMTVAELQRSLAQFDEPTYLHQAVVQTEDGAKHRYRDLREGIPAIDAPGFKEIRTHFHVPIFTETYQGLQATQSEIIEALDCWCRQPYTTHLEVETYTWDVLPPLLRTTLTASISRELKWVVDTIDRLSPVRNQE